jgi:hypothetical protein
VTEITSPGSHLCDSMNPSDRASHQPYVWFEKRAPGLQAIARLGPTGAKNMRTIRIIGMIAAMLASATVVTPASACPAGYIQCGGACCPGR